MAAWVIVPRTKRYPAGSHSLPFYPTIELDTGVKVPKAPDWLRKQAPSDAAEGKQYVGRLMGKVT